MKSPSRIPGTVSAGDLAADFDVGIDQGGDLGPVQTHLRDHPHQGACLGDHAVIDLQTCAAPLADGESGVPVGGGAGGDLGGLKDEVPPLGLQIQQLPQLLVLPAGLLALPGLLLQLSDLALQVLDLLSISS